MKSVNNVDITINLRMPAVTPQWQLEKSCQKCRTLTRFACARGRTRAPPRSSPTLPLCAESFHRAVYREARVVDAPIAVPKGRTRRAAFVETNVVPEPFTHKRPPKEDGELTEAGSVMPVQYEGEAFPDEPPPVPTP